MKLLGIDIGTSGLKVSVMDESGQIFAQSYRRSSYLPLPAGQAEQIPENWWQNLCSAVAEVMGQAAVEADAIAGVGLCGFHHCPVFLDADGQPSRPVMLLHDERLPISRADLERLGVLREVESLSQSMVSAGHFPPVLHYVRTHDPEGLKKTRWIVLAKDYLRFRITGEISTEICDATGMNLIEPGGNDWSPRLCELLGVPMEKLPSIGQPRELAGRITSKAADQIGLRAGTPVVYGGGDSHCALLGMGCINDGDTGLLLGTNSTLRTVFSEFVSHPQIKLWVQHHVVPNCYSISASSMAGASVLNWFKQNFVMKNSCSERDFERLDAAVSKVPVGSEGLVFLPYIYGERVPFYRPDASGGFFGIRYWHKPEHLLRSVYEGVAVNIRNCFDLINDCAELHNTTISELRLAGGAGELRLWHEMIADCLGRPIQVMSTKEAGTIGAAILAGIGLGVYSSYTQAVEKAVKIKEIIEPNPENYAVYSELQDKLNQLYERTS